MIDFDGQKVWINNPGCIARLCSISGEVLVGTEIVTVPDESFNDWRVRVKKHLDIDVHSSARPNWDKGKG